VSNTIRYDSLLVRELARELDSALAGARLEGAWLDRERLRLTLQVAAARRGEREPPSLLWQLHPTAGHLTMTTEAGSGARVQHRPRAPIAGVHAPPDERILIFELEDDEGPASSARRIIVELVTNQWNVIAIGTDRRITAVLRTRETAERTLRPGAIYEPPRSPGRAGAHEPLTMDDWIHAVRAVPPSDRLHALPRLAAWTSPLNAAWILGRAALDDTPDGSAAGADDATVLERAWRRYRSLAEGARLQPLLLRAGGRWQPYAGPAPGQGEPMPSLLAAFEEAAVRAAAVPRAEAVEEALAAVAERLDAVAARIRRLTEERAGATEDAQRLRRQADLLLSQLHRVTRGAPRARLEDLEGGTVDVELDPALSPAGNAQAMYDDARRRDRAAARIPRLLAAAQADRQRLEQLAVDIRDGTTDPARLERLERTRAAGGGATAPALPYRSYRSSGGLEIRVGRGARSNDELTFRHSSPNDVWLHARDAAGAHVVLRWNRTDGNPPARDMHEAAVLAALFSRARTSGTVPVDWTRRKYVRKPRRAAPGLVLPERVRTIFVQPDASLEERLRDDGTP
jgi:predicted ribosome quality control (RQC) complex YloA/Tae2 family protein